METVDERVREMVRRLVEAVGPDRVIMFGSRARGEAGKDSDVDLMIVAPSDLPAWQRTMPLYSLLGGLGLAKDLLWWTPEEVEDWREVRSHVISRALREGKVLYERAA